MGCNRNGSNVAATCTDMTSESAFSCPELSASLVVCWTGVQCVYVTSLVVCWTGVQCVYVTSLMVCWTSVQYVYVTPVMCACDTSDVCV